MRPRISILLPAFNNAATIRDTLESVKWADEILVVDSFSTDATLNICREYDARVIQHEYINSAKQKNWAVPQCRNDWVLQIDTDEILEPGARDEIEQVIGSAEAQVGAFRFPRKNHVLGRWIRRADIYPDFQIRLFRRGAGRWDEREVHAHVNVSGEIKTLEHHILHFGMPNISKQLRNLDRYTRYEADELRKVGVTFGWTRVTLRPWLVFLKRYFWHLGFMEGWRGFILCAYLAIYYFLSQAKLWEMEELGLEQSPR
ncbi:MAG TPA: glycosyltransferase family 2 protein [Pyrinomonadaceae bacterium]|nr:glycosyltransferase family 2 protein [Pyrinomonadaceae bacterium]